MRRRVVIAMAAFALVACRAIVGIEDQTVGDAGPGGQPPVGDAGTDAKTDGMTTPPAEAGPGLPDASLECRATNPLNKSDCGRCCHDKYPQQFDALANAEKQSGCICGSAPDRACTSECTGNDCMGNQMLSSTCAPCADQASVSNAGRCTNLTCNGPGCKDVLACLRGCYQ